MERKYRIKLEGCVLLTDSRTQKKNKKNAYIWEIVKNSRVMKVESCKPNFFGLEDAKKGKKSWVDISWTLVVRFLVPVKKSDIVRYIIDTFDSANGKCILYIREDNLVKY